jgi:hypothetical protein
MADYDARTQADEEAADPQYDESQLEQAPGVETSIVQMVRKFAAGRAISNQVASCKAAQWHSRSANLCFQQSVKYLDALVHQIMVNLATDAGRRARARGAGSALTEADLQAAVQRLLPGQPCDAFGCR